MPSEAEKYWQYSRECTQQAVEAETPELRDQLLDLARVWTEAALREDMNAKHRGRKPPELRGAALPAHKICSITPGDHMNGPPKMIESDIAAVERTKQVIEPAR